MKIKKNRKTIDSNRQTSHRRGLAITKPQRTEQTFRSQPLLSRYCSTQMSVIIVL